ncbi:MAG: hypothetical protein A2265_02430 [Bacteroidetes bacterium RIFOXYA12_FULL_33_9]|nr:MAG: hypothetical protein A2265_02430 [Bacteroidetes bacterium RIFOXYA12_FULL_33_9]
MQHYYTDEIDKYLIDYYKEQKEEYQVNLILGIVKNLLSSELIADKNYWKNEALKLIKKYKSDNGIGIQMNCIEILSCFKNINLITENFNYEDLRDSLKNTFIEACVKVAPNDISVIKRTIDYYVNHDNYVRLENLFSNSKESKSIITILNNLISNREFRNKIGSDSQFTDSFLDNIKNVWDKKIEKLIIKLLVESHDFVFWDEFAKKFSCLLQEKNSNFIYNLIDEIIKNTGKSHQFDLINLLIELITLNNATQIAEIFIEKKQKEIGAKVFSWLNYNKSGFYEIGNRYFLDIYSKYHSNTIDKLEQVSFNPYKIFLENLKTKSGDIFRFYNTHKVKIKENISPAESTELKNLIVNIILKYDFSKASITQEGNTIYRADIIRYFEDALSLFEDLKIEQALYRKKIIEFFPFAFTNDDSKIFDLLPNLTSDEIDSIVEFYSTERTDDLLTVNIGKLFSFCRRYNTEKVLMLLKSFVLNDKIRGNDRIQSIEINNIIKPDKDFFNEVFNLYKDFSNETEKILAYRANEYLIYLNDSNAIKWRLNEIKTTTKDLGILHLPLTKVTDSSFSKDYLDLLEFATKLDSSKSGQVFSICGTVISYFDNLKIYKSTQYLKQLDDFISKYQDLKWIYNLTEGYNRIRVNYLNYACVPSSFSECIQKYNLLKEKQFLTVNSPETLWYIIQDAIDKDIRNWVENEGAYKVIKDLSEKGETLIQKTLKGQLELALIKRGFRPNELRIKREEQLLNDKKPDFTICYGFIGQILIEIKRNYIKDVNSGSEDYKSILEQYITGSSSNYGIFLIFQTDEENKLSKILPKLEKTYSGNHNIKIIGIDCLCEKQ